MISYKLAKELKEAGFPQVHSLSRGEGYASSEVKQLDSEVYYPTLSELIESCGKDFNILWNCGEHWHAGNYTYGSCHYVDDYPYRNEEGLTPEEAVARLWLAIHKK